MMQSIKLCPKVKQNDFSGKQKRVGILGGSFNPPHVDEKKTIDANYRVEMTQLAIRDNYHFELETIELERTEKSYSFDTIQLLKEKNPDIDYYFIIGGDMVDYLPTWHRIDELVHEVQFVGVCRPGYPKETPYPVLWIEAPQMEISSTQIRKNVLWGQSIRYLVPESVEEYIFEKGLYQE